MSRTLLAASILLLAGSVTRAGEPPADAGAGARDGAPTGVVTLREAARKGLIEARGLRPTSYQRVVLQLENRAPGPLDVDVCASYLEPKRRGSCQRLGLGPPVTPSEPRTRTYGGGRIVVSLGVGEKIDLELNTCCLDAGKPAPTDEVFDVSDSMLPPVREKVLRWWAEHPTVPQFAVNTAIWQFREEVSVPTPQPPATSPAPRARSAAAHGGMYYRLDGGELFSLDPDGIQRFLGTEIGRVIPVEGAVYAVAPGADRKPELWRLALTGDEPWGLVTDLDGTAGVVDVIPGPHGNLALVTAAGLCFFDHAAGTITTSLPTPLLRSLSVRLGKGHRLWATAERPAREPEYRGGERFGEKAPVFELWSLDLETGEATRAKEYWTVQAMLAGPAGVFGISHKGRLRELVRDSFRDLGTHEVYARILAVGTKVLWLERADGRLAAVSARTGRPLFETTLPAADLGAFDLDTATDDLAFVRDGGWWRLRAADGTLEEVDAP